MIGKEQFLQGMWEYFSLERARAKKFLRDDEEGKAGRDTRPMATRVSHQQVQKMQIQIALRK